VLIVTALSAHNVIGVYPDMGVAIVGLKQLSAAGIAEDRISLLSRTDEKVMGEADTAADAEEVPRDVAKDVAARGAAGGALGGIAGFIAGAIAFGIPGVGPGVGAGIWATTLGGAFAGATAGGVIGGITEMWEARYKDKVGEGRALVGVHSDNERDIARAEDIMRATYALEIDRFNEQGRMVEPSERN
jgi:hypothetical protein